MGNRFFARAVEDWKTISYFFSAEQSKKTRWDSPALIRFSQRIRALASSTPGSRREIGSSESETATNASFLSFRRLREQCKSKARSAGGS